MLRLVCTNGFELPQFDIQHSKVNFYHLQKNIYIKCVRVFFLSKIVQWDIQIEDIIIVFGNIQLTCHQTDKRNTNSKLAIVVNVGIKKEVRMNKQ
jgi:hypothetical protein